MYSNAALYTRCVYRFARMAAPPKSATMPTAPDCTAAIAAAAVVEDVGGGFVPVAAGTTDVGVGTPLVKGTLSESAEEAPE